MVIGKFLEKRKFWITSEFREQVTNNLLAITRDE